MVPFTKEEEHTKMLAYSDLILPTVRSTETLFGRLVPSTIAVRIHPSGAASTLYCCSGSAHRRFCSSILQSRMALQTRPMYRPLTTSWNVPLITFTLPGSQNA